MVRNYRDFRIIQSGPFFEPPLSFETCASGGIVPACIHGKTSDHWSSFKLFRYEGSQVGALAGTVEHAVRSSSRLMFPVKIFLPKEQKVFEKQTGQLVLKVPARQSIKLTGNMETPSGERSRCFRTFGPRVVRRISTRAKGL